MYLHYNELKNLLVIKEENKNLFRQQTDAEKLSLREGLLFHKKLLSPLVVCESILGLVLVDGHHRWQLLSEVIKECPEFDLNIPLVKIEPSEATAEMMRTQLGRRNLSAGEIVQYVDYLREQGLTVAEAQKQTSTDLNVSVNKVKNSMYSDRQEKAKEYYNNTKHNDNSISVDTEPKTAQKPFDLNSQNNIDRTPALHSSEEAALHSSEEAAQSQEVKIDNTRDRTPEEIQEIEDRYSTSVDEKGKEKVSYIQLASNELERLNNLKESTINEMRADIDFYKQTALYPEIMILLSSLDKRIKELS